MRVRTWLAVGGIVLALAACTGSHPPSSSPSLSPSSTRSSSPSPSDGPGSPAPTGSATPPQPRVTKFVRAWTWTSPSKHSAALFNEARAIVQDGKRAIVASDVGPSGAVATSHAALTAIDLSTGKQVWRRTFAGLPDYLQLVDGVVVLTRGTPLSGSRVDTALVGINAANGKQLWSYTGFSIPQPTAPATLGSSIYVTVVHHLKAFGRRIDVHTGKEVTSRRVHSIDAPVAGNGVVIWDDHEGEVTAYSSDLHRQLWQTKVPAGTADDRMVGDVLVRVATARARAPRSTATTRPRVPRCGVRG